MTAPRRALLVVNYGASDLVADNLQRTALTSDTAVVIVDNFTTAAERERMLALSAQRGWTLLCPDDNLGFGGGMNAAAARAIELGAASLLLLNPDAYIEADGADALLRLVEADAEAIVSPAVGRPDGTHFASRMELDLATGTVRRRREGHTFEHSRDWFSGACLAVSAEMWQRLGGFDDDYFLYWEDVDLSVRAEDLGARLVFAGDVHVVHSAGGTQRAERVGQAKSPVYYFYNARNRLVFAAQHLDARGRRAWRARSVSAGWALLMRGGRRQLIRPHRTIWPVIRGTASGLRYLRTHAVATPKEA